MRQYIDLVGHILETGTRKENRTGVDTISTFNYNYEHDMQEGFPLLTTKAISWKNIVIENLWFLSGSQDIKFLQRHNCKFWDPWADSQGKVPSAYGNFWRHFPVFGTRDSSDIRIDGDPCLAYNDQIRWVLGEMRRNPMSRRMVVSAWAPENAQYSKLPPCHCLYIFNVQNDVPNPNDKPWEVVANYSFLGGTEYLGVVWADHEERAYARALHRFGLQLDSDGINCISVREPMEDRIAKYVAERFQVPTEPIKRLCLHLTQRSCDVALGVPYNLAGYAFLLQLFAQMSGLQPGVFAHTLVDAHVYTKKPDGSQEEYDHIPGLLQQIRRETRKLPKLIIDPTIRDLKDIEGLMDPNLTTEEIMSHFVLEGYEPHPAISFKVAV